MVEELRLWAIGINEVRACFAAPAELVARLRQITDTFIPKMPSRPGLLSKLGPLMRYPSNAPVIKPDVPTHVDADMMMTGHYVPSDRLVACWTLVRAWLDNLAVAKTTIPLAASKIDELEFDLVRAGVPTRLSIRHLWGHSLDIPLRPSEQMSIGYMEAATANDLLEQWQAALPQLETNTAELATPLIAFLSQLKAADHHPQPDLIAWWTSR